LDSDKLQIYGVVLSVAVFQAERRISGCTEAAVWQDCANTGSATNDGPVVSA
jgi:hypothetical protein